MTVGDLLDRMPADEFAEWQAFDQLEPLGGVADDYRAGIMAASLLNVHRKSGTPPIKPLELFPWHNVPGDPVDDSLKIKAAMRRLADQAEKTRNG